MVTDNLAIQKVDTFMHSDEVQLAFAQAIGDRNAGSFIMSVMLAVKNDESGKLALCTPDSIYISALRAATLRLSVDPSTGQAYLVAYGNKATLIVGYKGLQDMAVRTGKYRYMNVTQRYEGETTEADPISGLITLATLGGHKTSNKVIGWLAAFEMNPERGQMLGYAHTLYMTVEQIHAHAKKHNPGGYGRTDSRAPWKVNTADMERKTVLRILLRKWGYMDPTDQATLAAAEEENNDEIFDAEATTLEENIAADNASINAQQAAEDGETEAEEIPNFGAPAAPDPEAAAYNAALALWATDKDKKKIQFGSLPKSGLEYIVEHSTVNERVEAALLILEKKFNMPRPGAA